MNKIMLLLVGILLFGNVMAEKVGTDLSISVQCTNSTYANLTYAKYILNSIYIINSEKSMTKQGIFYNYTIPANSINQTGTLEYGYKCDVDGLQQSSGNQIFVSLMGESLTSGQGILYIVMIAGIFVIFVLTFYGALAFPWKNNRNEDGKVISINDLKYVKILLFALVYLELLFIIAILQNLSGYLLIEGTYAFLNIVYMIMLILIFPVLILLVFFTIVMWLSDKKTLKDISRGISVE